MRRPINTVNGTYKDPNLAFSAQDALNVIPMMTEKSGTRTVSQYRQAPGLKPFCRIGTNSGSEVGFVAAGAGRGLRVVDGKLYAVAGRNLWQITSAGVSVNYGTIPGAGRVSMAHNQRGLGNELAIDNGQSRYVYNTQTQDLAKVTDESFPGSFKAVFIDGYIVFVEPQGRYWGHSDLSNALVYNIFDQYEAEGQPDRIVTAHESNRELLIFGQDTTEAYVNNPSGSGEAPFVRATNTVIKSGCAARDSVCDVGLFTVYLDHNRSVVALDGYTPVPISTSVIDSALQACTKQQIANAYAFAVESEGFQIYYLTVPGKFTFGYDFKNREWHRRSSTGLDWWAVTDVVQWNGSWYALDSRRGDILELRWYDYPFDVQEELVREWVTGTISADQNPIFVNELELLFGCGGQAYTTVDFPEQPVGPSITGAAPDGIVGVPYTFTYTTTPGDSPISRTMLLSGALLDGGAWSQFTATISGTFTEPGQMDLGFRTFDTSELFGDHTDTINISAGLMALRNEGDSGTGSSLFGDLATASWDYDGLLQNKLHLIGTKTGFVTYSSGGHPARSLDGGVTWAESAGATQSGTGGLRKGGYAASTSTVVLPQGLDGGVTVSTDDGASFAQHGTYTANLVACIDRTTSRTWVIYNNQNVRIRAVNDDDFDNPTAETTLSGVNTNPGGAIWADDEECFIGMRTSLSPVPKLLRTTDGVTATYPTIPSFSTATTINAIAGGYIGGVKRVSFFTDSGEAAYLNDDGEWELSDSLPLGLTLIEDACFDGVYIYAIGGGGTNRAIIRSRDGKAFEVVTSATGAAVNDEWKAIAARMAA